MRFHMIVPAVLAAGLLLQCSDDNPVQTRREVADPGPLGNLGVTDIALVAGSTVDLFDGDLTLTYRRTVSDSRCPKDVTCIWAGVAEIELIGSFPDGGADTVLLHSSPDQSQYSRYPKVGRLGEYVVTLVDLAPYPETWDNGRPADTAILIVERFSPNPPLVQEILPLDVPAEQLLHTPTDLTAAHISDHILTVSMQYAGGCNDHYFWTIMSPPLFAETNPPSAMLYLRHFTHDLCEALVRSTRRFDMGSVDAIYRSEFRGDGELIIRLYGWIDDVAGSPELLTLRYNTATGEGEVVNWP